jgi:hypothetical protein
MDGTDYSEEKKAEERVTTRLCRIKYAFKIKLAI